MPEFRLGNIDQRSPNGQVPQILSGRLQGGGNPALSTSWTQVTFDTTPTLQNGAILEIINTEATRLYVVIRGPNDTAAPSGTATDLRSHILPGNVDASKFVSWFPGQEVWFRNL